MQPYQPQNESEDSQETDSTLGSDLGSSTSQSLSPSVMEYQYENGRRYHAYEAGRYGMPNDEQEASRLDLQHQIWLLTLKGKLYRSPLPPNITHAIDIGTGTGIWALDFADQHPSCQIIGTDLSPIQPSWVPPNCSFLVDDADNDREWVFPPLDFVHSRLLTGGFRDWPRYLRHAYSALKPGGWIELQESTYPVRCDDGTATEENDPFIQWGNHLKSSAPLVGVHADALDQFEPQLKEAGFINVVREVYKWPVGSWMGDQNDDPDLKQMGQYMLSNSTEMLGTMTAFFTRWLGWTKEEVDILNAKARASINDPTKHRYNHVTVHYAQKPLTANPSTGTTTAPV